MMRRKLKEEQGNGDGGMNRGREIECYIIVSEPSICQDKAGIQCSDS